MSLRGTAPAERNGEAGVTLVELLVSIFILGILMAAFVGGMSTSLQGVAANQREARAIALQNEMIERFETLDWDELTIRCVSGAHPWSDGADPPQDSEVGGTIVACDDDVGSFAPEATETRGEGDYAFEIETHIVFVDRDDSEEAETKQIVTFIRWETPAGNERETTVSAERGPPARSIGFVPESQDRDFDNVADDSDNCPDTANGDQLDTEGPFPRPEHDEDGNLITEPTHAAADGAPDGVGNACDADGDGTRDADDNCPNTFNWDQDPSACDPSSPPTTAVDISQFEIFWWQGGTWVNTGMRLCVDAGDSLAATHQFRATVWELPNGSGDVEMEFGKWTGGNEGTNPNADETRPGVYTDEDDLSPYDYSVFLEQGLGRFRDGKSTSVEVTAKRDHDGDEDALTQSVDIVPATSCPTS